jgi:hypothetical protein
MGPYGLNFLSTFRVKKWDFVDIFTNEFIFGVAFADLGYAGRI